jgi:hypothetical protein
LTAAEQPSDKRDPLVGSSDIAALNTGKIRRATIKVMLDHEIATTLGTRLEQHHQIEPQANRISGTTTTTETTGLSRIEHDHPAVPLAWRDYPNGGVQLLQQLARIEGSTTRELSGHKSST